MTQGTKSQGAPFGMALTDFAAASNLVSLFLDRADRLGDAPMLQAKHADGWRAISWAEVSAQVCRLAQSLRELGLADGDRVLIVAENRPEWCIADLAIMAAGCVSVPAYTTNTTRDHLHVLNDSGASAAIVANARLARTLLPAVAQAPQCRHVIAIDPFDDAETRGAAVLNWAALQKGDARQARAAIERRVATIGRSTLACIIYTSGTGGAPKGVRQHHGMILSNVAGAARIIAEDFGWTPGERFLSFLPLSHAYEHTGGQYLPIGLGAEIHYSEGLDKLSANIEETRPTIMVVVPRLFEVLRTRVMRQIDKQGGLPKRLLDAALGLAERRSEGNMRWHDPVLDAVLERTLRPKVRARFGSRMKALVSGGAPLNPEIGRFFEAMGLTLLQGYGQTEAGPVISCNRPSAGIRMETVGPPLDGVAVRIAADGEILVSGELVMQGYWNNPEASAGALEEGWLHTGDIGHLDSGGRIVITDRKKDMIVNDKGDNVSPQRVESMLTLEPEIGQAMVSGDRRPWLAALIVPDADWLQTWAKQVDKTADLSAVRTDPSLHVAIRAAIDRVNAQLSVTEKVRQFVLADEAFAIANGEMTPSLKIRRHVIRQRYGERLDALYKA